MLKPSSLIVSLFFICNIISAKEIATTINYTPKDSTAVILIPFNYRQSALYEANTYLVIDSLANLLLNNKDISLTIAGYSHADEGNDSVCKWLSDDRALFVKKYILGRGVDESRIAFSKGMGYSTSPYSNIDKNNKALICRAELVLTIPPPPPPINADRDDDGILNDDDNCPDEFGYLENVGCPDKDAILVPFGSKEDWLSNFTYAVLDSIVNILRENSSYTLIIQGHSYKTEGTPNFCETIATNRADVVKKYLLSRNISKKRIKEIKSFSSNRPLNAAKNPQEELANSRVQIFLQQ